MLDRIKSNKQAHARYEAAILSGDIIDPSDKVTRGGLLAEQVKMHQAQISGRIAQIDAQVSLLTSVGIGKKGKIRPSYRKRIDDYLQERDNLSPLICK